MESLPYVRIIRASNGWLLDCHSDSEYSAGPEVRLFAFDEDDANSQVIAFAAALTEVDRQIGVSSESFGATRIAVNVLGVVGG
tara:strand:+ start:2869 stop:3117 length:249 start_codon:yes stop_codon:yes gene_type:complete